VLAAAFTVVMMASIGLPGLNGFVSEFLVLLGTFLTHRWWAVVATAGVIVAALYLLWAYQQAFHGEPDPPNARMRDLGWTERVVVAPLLALIVLLGVYPQPVLDRITPAVTRLVNHVEAVTGTHQPAVAHGPATTASRSTGGRAVPAIANTVAVVGPTATGTPGADGNGGSANRSGSGS
jgi:NADH-quinone oxidoreductase subunit M